MKARINGRIFVRFGQAGASLLVIAAVLSPIDQSSAHNFVTNKNPYGGQNCVTGVGVGSGAMSRWTRSQALSYGMIADKEGYHWGGGCWDTSNTDGQPNDPQQTAGTHGEGPDCSGFVFKVWALNSSASSGYTGWDIYYYGPDSESGLRAHGPFTANAFKTGSNSAWGPVSKTTAITLDAFASSSHIGLIRQANTAYNTDLILQAKSEALGTGVRSETYRGNTSYSGVRRKNWSV